MNIIKKYWDSVYVYVLLLIPCSCIGAGIFWTSCKALGLYSHLSWIKILAFDASQLIYLGISFYFIYQNRKDSSYFLSHLIYVKRFFVITFFVQYCFILILFPSDYVWGCTFIFLAVPVFFFDVKLMVVNMLSYFLPLLVVHISRPEQYLPMGEENLGEIIAFRIVALGITSFCILLITYFVERFLIQGQDSDTENVYLLEKQLEYYKNTETLDMELRKFRHDIHNHFICMEYLLDKGDKVELHKYFKDLQESFSVRQKMYFSGNDIIDAIMNYDLPHHCVEEVGVEVYGELPEIRTISAMDLCTVFSNILSNAIASANKCADLKESKIVVYFGEGKRYFSISVSNSIYDDKLEEKLKRKKRSDTDKNHGFGLHKIREVVEKYEGRLERNIENEMITVTVYLPI